MTRCRPRGLAESVGFRWPTLGAASALRTSSPRTDQGGSVKASCRPTFLSEFRCAVVAPQSDFDRRRFAPADASANPTTPASAGDDSSLSVAPPPVPSPPDGVSADAVAEHEPAAPTRTPASRWWSAYTDDVGRSEFPLDKPPSFAPQGPVVITTGDREVASPSFRES